jgi:hypothetical protein
MTKLYGIGIFAAFSVIAISPVTRCSASQEPPTKFSLAISGPQSVAVDSPFRIEIKITNISKVTLHLAAGYSGNLPYGYKYIVRDEKDDLVSEDPLCTRSMETPPGGMRPPCRTPGSYINGLLRPGGSWAAAAQLTDLYWFVRPGKYTIQVSRREVGMPVVYSNVLTLQVLAKQ